MAKKKLAAYQAKRDFKKTSEPSGRGKIGAAEYPRFVIQKHAATRLHYDLRLEHDGVFKSWAVTRGPVARSRRQAPGRRGRGPPARLRRFRRHDPQGRVRRRHRHALGPRLLDARGQRRRRCGAAQGRSQVHARRRQAAGQLGAGAHAQRPRARQAQQLAPDQAPRRVRTQGWRGGSGAGPLDSVGALHGGDRRRQGARAAAVHGAWQQGGGQKPGRHLAFTQAREAPAGPRALRPSCTSRHRTRRRRHGRHHLQARQGALAGRRQRRSLHQARPRPLSRAGRTLDDRASAGPPLLHHPRAGRHPRAELLSAARRCPASPISSSWSPSRATASRICRSIASRA